MNTGIQIRPGLISKPIQLLAALLVALVFLEGMLLAAATRFPDPAWVRVLLAIAALLLIPGFPILLFRLITKHRPYMTSDQLYFNLVERYPRELGFQRKSEVHIPVSMESNGAHVELPAPAAEEKRSIDPIIEVLKSWRFYFGISHNREDILFGITSNGIKITYFCHLDAHNDLIIASYAFEMASSDVSGTLTSKLLELNRDSKRGMIGLESEKRNGLVRIRVDHVLSLEKGSREQKQDEFRMAVHALVQSHSKVRTILEAEHIEYRNFTTIDVAERQEKDSRVSEGTNSSPSQG